MRDIKLNLSGSIDRKYVNSLFVLKSRKKKNNAALIIQRAYRAHRLQQLFQTSRNVVHKSFAVLKYTRNLHERSFWRTIDLRQLSYDELSNALMSLNLPGSGTKVQLINRLQKWVDYKAIMSSIAIDAAVKAAEKLQQGQGAVYYCEAKHESQPECVNSLKGKNITCVAAGAESDAAYAVEAENFNIWLCRESGWACKVIDERKTQHIQESWQNRGGNKDNNNNIQGSHWLQTATKLQVLATEHITSLYVARTHVVALAEAGELFSWGDNEYGQLGIAASETHPLVLNKPEAVIPICNYIAVNAAAGSRHTVAVCDSVAGQNGVVFCWGDNSFGQLGIKQTEVSCKDNSRSVKHTRIPNNRARFASALAFHPVVALREYNIRKVACGSLHTLAIASTGELFAWGDNDGNRLGLGDQQLSSAETRDRKHHAKATIVYEPTRVKGLLQGKSVVDIACGVWHSVCIAIERSSASQRRVFTWGTGMYGQLASGSQVVCSEPKFVRIPAMLSADEKFAEKIACGIHHTAVLTTDMYAYTLGSMDIFSSTPRQIAPQSGLNCHIGEITSIACGRTFTIFNSLPRSARSFEKGLSHRLWRKKEIHIPKLPIESTLLYSNKAGEKDNENFKIRLQPGADGLLMDKRNALEKSNVEDTDIYTLIHPLCRLCWHCNGYVPSPANLWVCRGCCHERGFHGKRCKPLEEYEAIEILRRFWRTKRARQTMQRARERQYQRVYSIGDDKFFYYNTWTKCSSWARPAKIENDDQILIRDPDELPFITPPLTQDRAALRIQRVIRGNKARKKVKIVLSYCFEKHYDFAKKEIYYCLRHQARKAGEQNAIYTDCGKIAISTPALLRRLYDLGTPYEVNRHRRFTNISEDEAATLFQNLYKARKAWLKQRQQMKYNYSVIKDEVTGKFYYYDNVTKKSSWEPPSCFRHENTEEGMVGRKVVTLASRIHSSRDNSTGKHVNDIAATIIQCCYRKFRSRVSALEQAQLMYQKHFDLITSQPYYFNVKSCTSSWIKPRIFGAKYDLEAFTQRTVGTKLTSGGLCKSNLIQVSEEGLSRAEIKRRRANEQRERAQRMAAKETCIR